MAKKAPRPLIIPLDGEEPVLCLSDLVGKRRRPLTLHEVGDLLGITRERVRQLEQKALKKLARRGGNELFQFWRDANEE